MSAEKSPDQASASPAGRVPSGRPLSTSLFRLLQIELGDHLPVLRLTKATLVHLSHSLENLVLQYRLPAMMFTGFQESSYWRQETARYQELAQVAQQICIFAGKPLPVDSTVNLYQVQLAQDDLLRQDWFLLILSERFSVLLCGLDALTPATDEGLRQFDTFWSFDPVVIERTLDLLEQVLEEYNEDLLNQLRVTRQQYPHFNQDSSLITRLTLEILQFEEQLNQQLKESMERIQASEARFRQLSDNSPDSIYIIDLIENRVVYNNRPILRPEVAATHPPSFNLLRTIHPEDMATIHAVLDTLNTPSQTGVLAVECRLKTSAGTWEWAHLRLTVLNRMPDGQAREVLVNLTIITHSKTLDEALRASQRQLRDVIASIPHHVYMMELDATSTTRLSSIFLSPGFVALTGYSIQELEDPQNLWSTRLIHPEDRPLAAHHWQFLGQGKQHTVEYRIIRADGREVWVQDSARGMPDERRVYGVISDITERRRLEASLLNQEKLRLDLEKERELNALKTTLMTMISHEFRTPLAVILSATEFIERYGKRISEEAYNARMQVIRQQIQHLDSMMGDISRIVRSDMLEVDFHPTQTDLSRLFHETMASVRTAYSLGEEHLILTISGEPYPVPLDQRLMKQVLTNLLDNAVKYSPVDGTIESRLTYNPNDVVIEITDHGIGIPAPDIPMIFETFHRAANVGSVSGTGLGLKIVHDYIELHHGKITVQSIEGQGTTFTILLPREGV